MIQYTALQIYASMTSSSSVRKKSCKKSNKNTRPKSRKSARTKARKKSNKNTRPKSRKSTGKRGRIKSHKSARSSTRKRSNERARKSIGKSKTLIFDTKIHKGSGIRFKYIKKFQNYSMKDYNDYIKKWENRAKIYYIKMSQIDKLPDNAFIITLVSPSPKLPYIYRLGQARKGMYKFTEGNHSYAALGSSAMPSILVSNLKNIGPWPYYDKL